MDFTTYRFKDCIAKIIDNRGRNPDKYYDTEKYPVIDNYLIKNELHPVVRNANRFLSQSQFDNFLRGYVTKDDLLMTLVGNGIGNVSLSPNDKIAIVQNTVGFRLKEELFDSCFAFYYFKTINFAVKNLDRGSSQPSINRTDVLKLKIQLPHMVIQKRIANILLSYDDLIENNNKRISLLEKAAQELYKEWFVRFRFPGHEKSKFINGLPEGWERKKISEYYNTSSGGTPSRSNEQFYINGKYPWIKTGEVKDTIIIDTEEYITEDAVKQSSAKLIPARSVIMAMYGVNIGMLGYADREMTCNQACCIFADKREFSARHYLYQYLMSIREYLLLISFGAAQQNVSQDLIKKIKIVMPTNDVVIEYEKKIDTIYNSIRSLLYKNKNLIKQRDLLLPRLMSGKLEV